MSTFSFNGTSKADTISTWDLNYDYPGYTGFKVNGLDGDDTINLSITGREGLDSAYGGNGNDFMSGHAFMSSSAIAGFFGGYGNDRVYFSSMTPELNSDGKPNFTRTSNSTTEINLVHVSDGSVLKAIISDTVERIGFGFTGKTYLTEDIANDVIRSVDWDEEYFRTYYDSMDWYLNGLNTYKEYHGFDYDVFSLGLLESGEVKEFEGSVASGRDYEVLFSVNSQDDVYTWFSLTELTDDVDLSLYRKNSRGEYILENTSDASGSVDETFFDALSNGSYKLTASLYEDLDSSSSASFFKLTIDSESFLENAVIPNDQYFDQQWSLFNTGQADGGDNQDIAAPEAWKLLNKSPDVVIAVIDSGVRTSHQDLKNNLWINSGEISGNGLDDDRNGYIDDVYGWNFVEDRNWWDPQGHGTHVAGLIAAEGNNSRGISGVTWDAQLMCLDVLDGRGSGSFLNIAEAIYYAADNGADVINMSLGASYSNTSLSDFKRLNPDIYSLYYDALSYAVGKGCVVVCAAGNDDLNTKSNFQVPASFSSIIPGVISVAAVGNTGDITQYSNYSELITIAAPGGDFRSGYGSEILSTYHLSDSSYHSISGTSMAAPLVSGAAALIMQNNRVLRPSQVEDILTNSASNYKSLEGFVEGGNFLNLNAALALASEFDEPSSDQIIARGTSGNDTMIGGSGDDELTALRGLDYLVGHEGNDILRAGEGRDTIIGGDGDDYLGGGQGGDSLLGGNGNDIIRAGNGRDIITGGFGADDIEGGFGHNTFTDERDGSSDSISFQSDQFAHNWLYGRAGMSPNGEKVDIIKGLDDYDRLFVQGVETSELSFSEVTNFVAPTGSFSGIGIFANGFLEGLYTGGDLTLSQLQSMTTGVDT